MSILSQCPRKSIAICFAADYKRLWLEILSLSRPFARFGVRRVV